MRAGSVSRERERDLMDRVPDAVNQFESAFAAMDRCISLIEESGLHKVMDARLGRCMRHLVNPEDSLTRAITNYFTEIGSPPEMITDLKRDFGIFQFDLIKRFGRGHLLNLRNMYKQGVDANRQMLNYTKDHGLRYIRGRCGPPAWAFEVSKILGWAGESVWAWVVVIIIAALVAAIIIICSLDILPAEIQSACDYVRFELSLSF